MSEEIIITDGSADRARTPVHLWIVAALSALWNGFGCYEYVMTRTQGATYIKSMMPDVDADAYMAYINGFPIWASFGWGLGVWTALLGTILLILRNKLAVPAFGLSLIGAVLGLGYQIANPVKLSGMDPTMSIVAPIMVIGFCLFLYFYSRAMRARGVLR